MRPSLKQNNVPPSLPQRSLLAIALILLWILYLYSTGLYFFSKGFLLTRLRLPNTSSCKVLPSLSPLSDDPTAGQPSGCWYPARYKKAVFVVIDALRFDFAVYNSTLEGATDPTADGQFDSPTKIPYYLNRLKTIHSKVKEEPQNALLFQIIADPPTTTLQRLKGITTGSLPTFVEAGNNFGGAAIGEDNIIDQLASLGRRVAFMGDDTWVALFPTSFKESLKFPSESLIVWDLHTVDNEVIEHMFPLLEESNKDEWDVMVAHFLGVDHCGHRFGPNHVTMGDKLSQMDATISRLLDRVDDDTIVIVMGDHGMDSKGDHGGESPQEKEAAMFMYSKKGLVGPSATQMKGKWFRSKETFDESASTGGQGFLEKFLSRIDSEAEWDSFTDQLGGHRTIPQIDVLPTLSLLLGVPIPFNNLGSIIPELFYHPSPPSSGGSQSEIELLLRALQLNARQVHRYMFEYSRTQPSTELAIVNERNLVELFKKAEAAAAKLDEKTPSGARFQVAEDAAAAYMVYLRSSLRTCRQIWAQFDTPLMGLGLVFLLVTNGVALVHLRRVRRRIALASFSDSQGNPECKNPNVRSGMIVLSGGVLGALLSCGFGLRQHFSFSMVDWLILGSASGSVLAYAFGWNEDTNAERKTRPWSRTDLAFGLFLVLPQLFFSASNSTLINEDSITAFLLQSFAVFHLLKAGTARIARTRSRLIIYTLVFLVLTRFNRHLTICREEQFSYCIPTFYASETSSVPSNLSIALISVLGIVGPWFLGKVLKDSESFHAVAVIWINYGLRLMFALSTGYWLLDMEENMEYRNVKMNMARIAAAIVVFFGVPNWWRQPECLKAESAEVSGVTGKRDGGAPASANGSGPEHPKRKVIILGTGNILGAPYLAFMAMIFALLMVVQQPSGILALAAELGQIIAAWEIFDYSRDVDYERKNLELPPSMMVPMLSSNPQTNHHPQRQPPPQPTTHRNITLIQPLILTLIANQAFFATGHQRTLSSIQWNSGFIGLHETSFVISPILVGMNTFGAYILAGCAVPALAFWKLSPQDFFVSSPSLQRAAREQILQAGLMFLLITFGASTTAASFWTANFRRHLMVWKIFAPTWMFLVTSSVVSGLSMITVGLGIGTARTIKVIGGLCGWSSQ